MTNIQVKRLFGRNINKIFILVALSLTMFSAIPALAVYGVQTKTSHCVANQALPDPACTPGAILTTNISVICKTGYTKTVRDVPLSERKKVFAEYGIPYSQHSNYEVDHLISLELGGSNDISNLWPESYGILNGSLTKDKLENYLHTQVCKGKMTIAEAQKEISSNWLKYANVTIIAPPKAAKPVANKEPAATQSSSLPITPVVATPPVTTPPATSHVFYTSSYSTSKIYYCDTDSAWKSLSAKYLQKFSSVAELLKVYPAKTLHEPCK